MKQPTQKPVKINKSKQHKNYRSDWATPHEVFERIEAFLKLAGLPGFVLDTAASIENAKVNHFFDAKQNGLAQEWATDGGLWWCNPPFDQSELFCKKAHEEQQKGNFGIMLLPNNAETVKFRTWITHCNRPRLMWPQRISFLGPDGTEVDGNITGSWLVAFMDDESIGKLLEAPSLLAGEPWIRNATTLGLDRPCYMKGNIKILGVPC